MDLQSTFYTIAIFFMAFLFIIFLAVAVFIWRLYRLIYEIKEKAIERPLEYIEEFKTHPAQAIGAIAILLSRFLTRGMRGLFRRN